MTVVETVFTAIAALCAALMMLLTSADAFSRYALNSPLLGAYEITEKYLMVAAIFLGLAYAYRGGAFIRVTFSGRSPVRPRPADRADHFAYLVTLGFALVIMYATAQAIAAVAQRCHHAQHAADPDRAGLLLSVPLGFLAMTLLLIADLPRIRTRQSALFATRRALPHEPRRRAAARGTCFQPCRRRADCRCARGVRHAGHLRRHRRFLEGDRHRQPDAVRHRWRTTR